MHSASRSGSTRHGETTFPTLKAALDLTEGYLSSHLGKMGDAGAISAEKSFVERRPQTTYALTDEGRERFEAHVETLEARLDDQE